MISNRPLYRIPLYLVLFLMTALVMGCETAPADSSPSEVESTSAEVQEQTVESTQETQSAETTNDAEPASPSQDADELMPAPLLFQFLDAESAELSTPAPPPTILSAQPVAVNIPLLLGDTDRIMVNLSPDVQLIAVRDSLTATSSGGSIWSGHLESQANTQIMFAINDSVVIGTINLFPTQYQLQFVRDGVHAIYEIDPSSFPED